MNMKRFCALLLAALMLAPAALAEDTLLNHAVGLACLLDEMAGSETYISLMSGSEEMNTQVSAWAEGDHEEPVAVFAVSLPLQTVLSLVGDEDKDVTAAWSANLVRQLEMRVIGSLPSIINSRNGAVMLAASSVCQASTAFAYDSLTADVAYVLLYQDAAPVMVCFTMAEDGVVSASASFLAGEQAASMATAEDVVALLEDMPVQVEPVAMP